MNKNIAETLREYAEMVDALKKPGDQILAQCTADKLDLLHMVIGLSGEVGELLDAVKKFIIYGKPLDVDNVREELGDVKFYYTGILLNPIIKEKMCEFDIIRANVDKLSARYHKGKYSDQQAIDRADKA